MCAIVGTNGKKSEKMNKERKNKKSTSYKEKKKMTTKRKFSHKLISVFLCVVLFISCVPFAVAAAPATTARASYITRVADPATADGWKEFFLPQDGTLSTENAGGIWTNKSVYTDATAFDNISMQSEDGMLIALSAIASNMSITGMSSVSTDTILVLDVSGSMGSGYNDVASELVDAANTSIATLLEGTNNRIGVVLYSASATTLLPLGRYKTTDSRGRYLSISGNTISIDGDVRTEDGGYAYSGWYAPSREVSGGTYIQSGIIRAMELFTANSNTNLQNRKPVMVVMTDGAPTYASTDFRSLDSRNMGGGSSTTTAIGFATQLTAAYAKQQIEAKYGTSSLFYTLGLAIGSNRGNMSATQIANEKAVATSVLNPSANSTAIASLWSEYNKETLAVGRSLTIDDNYSVTKVANLSPNYVNRYFNSDDYTNSSNDTLADALKNAFAAIVADIELQSQYYPTLVEDSENHSGYITFTDKIGKYMNVTDIKGIRIGDILFSGADMSSNFVTGGGSLGTYENPTSLGDEMVWAVQARLGLATPEQARTLIGLAYENGQLSYTNDTTFSNYIGWYANAAGQYLGFWHDRITTMPDPADPTLTDATRPAYIIKSYGYLGEANNNVKADMMYATVQLREDIVTGEQTVIFAIPASLIPTITYAVTLGEDGKIQNLTSTGATDPIQLIYEVALKDGINQYTVKDVVAAEYLTSNTNPDGSVNFYTNQYEVDNSTGYGKVNTYAYYRPSRENDRYYYQEDTVLYSDAAGTKYISETKPTGSMYHGYTVYKKTATGFSEETVYHLLSAETVDAAIKLADNSWYAPVGTVRRDYNGFVLEKAENTTGTLSFSDAPFTDIYGRNVTDTDHRFVFGVTHGNNGKVTLKSETGIKLSKELAAGTANTDKAFSFTLTNTTNAGDGTNYPAYKILINGSTADTNVQFTNGVANVSLKAGESLYIGGMIADDVINIKEAVDSEYVVHTVNGTTDKEVTLTIEANLFKNADFVNALRGKGNLTVSKQIEHLYGAEYTIPYKEFDITIALSLEGAPLADYSLNGGAISTNGEGKINITLAHNQQFELIGLPDGTAATVTESLDATEDKGFTASYFDNGIAGDGKVEIAADTTASVIVVNAYSPESTTPNIIELVGTKNLTGRTPDAWTDNDVYEFELQRYDNGVWVTLGTKKQVNKNNKTFDFTTTIQAENYTMVGSYYYRLVEIEPADAVEGVAYDKTVHAFAVDVTDIDMDGYLEVTDVRAFRENNPVITGDAQNGFRVSAQFTNIYSATGNTNVALEINKSVTNDSGSTLPKLSGFTFGLYKPGQITPAYVSEQTTGTGTTRLVISDITEVGEHNFVLKEMAPNPIPKGWTYSAVEIPVTIKVIDDGFGVKSAIIYKTQDGADGATNQMNVGFTNVYSPEATELTVDFVSKTLRNKALVGNDFSFEVRSYNPQTQTDAPVLNGKNNANGDVIFNDTLKYDKVGTYFYNVVEISTDGNGITTDKNIYRVVVTVADIGGTLQATHDVVNVEADTIEFVNVYTAQPTKYSIRAKKELTSLSGTTERRLINEEFTFALQEVDENGNEKADGVKLTAKNTEAGEIVFDAIPYNAAGTYYYAVKEQVNDGIYDIEFDNAIFTVTVVVTDDGMGNLNAEPISYAKDGENAPEGIIFNNVYKSLPVKAEFLGDKILEGRDLREGEFEFALYKSDESLAELDELAKVKNNADGSFKFEQTFDKVGNYYFLIKELAGEVSGISYDGNVYGVKVAVTDNLKGQLVAEVLITDQNGIPQEAAEFVNKYEASGNANVWLNGTKTLTGGELKDNEFTFELYEANEDFTPSGDAIKTVKNIDGKFEFGLTFGADQIGNTYYFVAKELNGGETVNNVKFDSTVYKITVSVEDDLNGGVKTVVTVVDGEGKVESLDFVNEVVEDTTEAIPTSPQTGYKLNLVELFALLIIGGGLLATAISKLKKAK